MSSFDQYRRLLTYVRPHWRLFAFSLLATVALAATEPAMPALMKPLLDGSFVEKDPEMILLMPILLVLLFVVRGLATLASAVSMEAVSSRVVTDLRSAMFDKLLTLPASYFDQNKTGNLVSQITFNVDQLANTASRSIVILVRDSLSIVGLLAWILYLDWQLASIVLALAPLVAGLVKLISARIRHISHTLQHGMGDMTHTLNEVLRGSRVIRLYGGQAYERSRFDSIIQRVRHFRVKFSVASTLNVQVTQVLAVATLGLIAYLAANRDFSVGEFVSFFGAMALILSPLKRLTGVNAELQRGLAASESVFNLLDQADEPDQGTHVLTGKIRGRLDWQQLTFHYQPEGPATLQEISFSVEPGQSIALVGPSGSGKSTLVSLLARFYSWNEGNILLDGVDIREIPLQQLRDQMALVSQDVVLFSGSIRENIAYGHSAGASDEAIFQAARDANALDFINRLPDGMESEIGDNGVRLSGGQRQRLAIARALLKDAPILILDEATSALDSESERQIQEALERLKRDRTTFIIAHRLSTIESADHILVLENGRIVESGTHEQLLRKGGIYQHLYQIQYANEPASS